MRYTVEVAGRTVEVDVVDGPEGAEAPLVAVGGGPGAPARLAGQGGVRALAWGDRRAVVTVEPDPLEPGRLLVGAGARPLAARAQDARQLAAAKGRGGQARGPRALRSPMPGVIVEVRVGPGEVVAPGQVLLVLEAMKMQNELRAEAAAAVVAVHARAGQSVAAGAALLDLGPPPA